MDAESYDELLNLVMPMIVKQNTTIREAISPNARFSITLRFLVTGNSFEDYEIPHQNFSTSYQSDCF